MDDYDLNFYTFTEQEQIRAAQIFQSIARRPISKRNPTYCSFPVRLDSHWAAVHIVITPSLHPGVKQTVQYVVGAYFQLFGWDFGEKNCYTEDPACSLHNSCYSNVHSVLRSYGALAKHVTEEPGGGMGETGNPGTKRRRIGSVTGLDQSKPIAELWTKSKPDATSSSRSSGKPLSIEEKDKATADKLVATIRNGLSKVRECSLKPNVPDVPDGFELSADDSYERCVTKLMDLANALDKSAETKQIGSWHARYLAGCVTLARSSLPARPAGSSSDGELVSRTVIKRQVAGARVINMIVSGLWKGGWQKKAYLVYHALAATHCKLSYIQRVGDDRLSAVAKTTIEALNTDVPDFDFQEALFDPPGVLCELLELESYQSICDILKLPPLRGTNGDRTSSTSFTAALSEGPPSSHQPTLLSNPHSPSPLAVDAHTGQNGSETAPTSDQDRQTNYGDLEVQTSTPILSADNLAFINISPYLQSTDGPGVGTQIPEMQAGGSGVAPFKGTGGLSFVDTCPYLQSDGGPGAGTQIPEMQAGGSEVTLFEETGGLSFVDTCPYLQSDNRRGELQAGGSQVALFEEIGGLSFVDTCLYPQSDDWQQVRASRSEIESFSIMDAISFTNLPPSPGLWDS
ncbi:MAG: hypothetical protein M1839_008579 [Geoglossum umbratile]|nr:MAG: hypothetical protein M1839_008579 [Geoglossum umbratile]